MKKVAPPVKYRGSPGNDPPKRMTIHVDRNCIDYLLLVIRGHDLYEIKTIHDLLLRRRSPKSWLLTPDLGLKYELGTVPELALIARRRCVEPLLDPVLVITGNKHVP